MERIKLIILVGVPGSGKTHYAQKYVKEHPNTIHLSSDKIREELWGNEATQGDPGMVFSIMQSRAVDALHNGQSVVYDATNVTRKDRSYILALCPKFVQIEAHVVWAPIETCIERDANRERTVGKAVIDKMLKRFQPPFYDEGIDEIEVVVPDNFDAYDYDKEVARAMKVPHDNPHHTLDVFDHCVAAFKYANEHDFDVDLQIAALMHDIGKPYVKAFVDTKGNPCEVAHYYSHDAVSAWITCGLPDADPYVTWLVGNHMGPFLNQKYYKNLSPFLKAAIDLLHEADLAAH